jgi:tRNA pseudouridine-54 N-methylase
VIINKYDRCQSFYKDLENEVDKELAKALKKVIGQGAYKIKTYSCIFIRHRKAERLLSSIISDIAFTLLKKKRTFETPRPSPPESPCS